jgi:tRNA modification GTPase
VRQRLTAAQREARQGVLLQQGLHVVIAGRPNAGKSSLLNRLAGQDVAEICHTHCRHHA